MNKVFYSPDHLWLRIEGDEAVVGITDYAQEQLGDIMYVELPQIGAALTEESSFGVIESVKTASELIAPASGVVTGVNEALREEPWRVNEAPLEDGWILKMRGENLSGSPRLLDTDAYSELIGPSLTDSGGDKSVGSQRVAQRRQ